MNKLLLAFLVFALFSCNPTQNEIDNNSSEAINSSQNFDWLLGEWKVNQETKGKESFESWEKVNENHYSGIGISIQYGDTIFQEKMNLMKSGEQWDLSVIMPDETKATVFKGTSFNETEFTCMNQENDFPKTIKYWIDGDILRAEVFNDEINIPFEFKKLR